MRILHVSDLHIRSEERESQLPIVDALLNDVALLHGQRPIDLIVFSGDLSYSGDVSELQLGVDVLLEPLQGVTSLSRDRVIVVPGNHDVSRRAIDEFAEEGLERLLTSDEAVNEVLNDSTKLERATERLSTWAAFERGFYSGVERTVSSSLGWHATRSLDSLSTRIVGLNSSWRGGGTADKGKLIIGQRQLADNLDVPEEAHALRLIAVHHPTSWLAEWDESTVRRYLELAEVPTLVFSGHSHKPEPSSEFTHRGAAVYARAGCLYASPTYENSFSVVDVDLDHAQVQFSIRMWYSERRCFDAATKLASDGQLHFPLSESASTAIALARPYNEVTRVLTEQAYEKSVIADYVSSKEIASVEDILVEPRFFALPYRDALAAVQAAGVDKPSPVDPTEALRGHQALIINADPQGGVTNSLLWIQAAVFASDLARPPVFVRFSPRFKASRFEGELREKAGLVMDLEPGGSVPPLLIALDDVRCESAGYYDALAKYVAEHPEHRFLFGTHGDENLALADALRSRNVEYGTLHLGPFGSRQVRELIEKLTGSREPTILRRVYELIGLAHLPRTPFVMATLVAVLSRQQQLSALNESGLLDTYVAMLLAAEPEGVIDEQAMDPKRREYFLAWFAALLTERKTSRMPRVEVEEAFLQRFKEFGWGAASSPGRVVQNLIDRRLLVQDDLGVGFRLEGLQAFFAAKHMNGDEAFARAMLADALTHAEIIRHAAGLKRTDRELLAQVGDIGLAHITADELEVAIEMFDLIRERPGWSDEEPGVELLRTRLHVLSEMPLHVPDDEADAARDEHYDRAEFGGEGEPEYEGLFDEFEQLIRSVGLLSSVLRSSELVDDLELKETLLKAAVHGWGLLAVVAAVREDQSRPLRDAVREAIPSTEENQDLLDRIERFAELITTVVISFIMRFELGTVHMQDVIRRVLDDEEFMRESAHALFATLLYSGLNLPGTPARLRALYDAHGAHPLVAEVVRTSAVIAFREETLSKADEKQLEDLIARVYAREAVQQSGPSAPLARGKVKSEVVRLLHRERARLKVAQSADDALAPLDALDALEDDPSSELGEGVARESVDSTGAE